LSFFVLNEHERLSHFQQKVETAVSDEEDSGDVGCSSGDPTENISILADGMAPTPGGPFSALTPSMWPQELLSQLGQPEDPNSQPDYRFDWKALTVQREIN
jgi:small G protein signaling modulator 3